MEEDLIKKIIAFRNERNWEQFHNPKDLAISISLEASELLEIFQWSGSDLEKKDKLEEMKEELADILIYSVLLTEKLEINITDIIKKKLQKNEEKYNKEKSYGSSKKYTELR
ncbi:MAG: nucleotide pyrophosphohydrolase [Bacteroidales bacterium]|nr:nucleotide pyrophosphohydrolase [Bacteroidales bacterium]